MKKLFTLLFIPVLSFCQVAIPDQNFENKLIQLGYDNVLDGQIYYNFDVDELDLSGSYIQDLTGIEAFINLQIIDLSYNLLNQVDLTPLYTTVLENGNYVTSLEINLEFNPNLNFLDLSGFNLALDFSIIGTSLSCIQTNLPGYHSSIFPSYSNFFYTECGCKNPEASNYEFSATGDDGSCIIYGCIDSYACNFDENATNGISSICEYSEEYYDCTGNCLIDLDGDGVCHELEIPGCTDSGADNFNPIATEDDNSCYFTIYGCTDELACNYDELANEYLSGFLCEYSDEYYDCDGGCLFDLDEDGICDELEVLGCTNSEANNFNQIATEDDNSCYFTIYGCTDELACNYDELANEDLGGFLCEYSEEYYDCVGECLLDSDFDNVCDEIDNCPENYNPLQEDFDFDDLGDACDGLSLNEDQVTRKLIRTLDILGRDIQEDGNEKIRLYIYDDGFVERKSKL